MKTFLYSIFILLLPITLHAQASKGFDITGHIDSLKDGEIVILCHFTDSKHDATWDDSCFVTHGGDFHLKGISSEKTPKTYIVAFDDHGTSEAHRSARQQRHRFWVDSLATNIGGEALSLLVQNGDHIKINGGNIYKMKHNNFEDEVTVEGSRSYFALSSLLPMDYVFKENIAGLNRQLAKIKDSIGYDKNLVGGIISAKAEAYKALSIFMLHPRYLYTIPLIPFIALDIEEDANDHASYEMKLYQGLTEEQKKSPVGEGLKSFAILAAGQPFPQFTLPNPEGKMIALKDIVAKSKITIVHIWASNSIERERYQQELRVLFGKYHDRGLNVIGLSADSLSNDWKIRVQIEKYPWENVSDLKGNLKGGIVNDLYLEGGHAIPNTTNVLLDEKGKIIAWDANGVVLQWYLEKYLGDK